MTDEPITPLDLEGVAAKLAAGRPLDAPDLRLLFAARDLIAVGALADERRRHHCGNRVTYNRVFEVPLDRLDDAGPVPSGATEVRLTGAPASREAAATALAAVRATVDEARLTAFSLADIVAAADRDRTPLREWLQHLRERGLRWLSEAPVDRIPDLRACLEVARSADLRIARLTVHQMQPAERTGLLERLIALDDLLEIAGAFAPLPRQLPAAEPSTGYDDVKLVAVSRLALPDMRIQIDWQLYGPKLAQVALTFGANDLDAVSPLDESAHGPRRAPLEEVRRNIAAAGFAAVPRTAHFEAQPV